MALEKNAELRGFDFFLGADEEMSVQKNGKLFCDIFGKEEKFTVCL